MSSHHIVKEKQEPALLILNIESFDEEYLGQLLEWSPTILVAETEVTKVLSMGIKIDYMLTSTKEISHQQEHVKTLISGNNFLETGLKYLISEGYPSVNIINNHFIAKEYLYYVPSIDLVIFFKDLKIYPIKSGFSKWKAESQEIFVYHSETVNDLSTAGLEKIDTGHYQTEKDGFFSFTFEPPCVFIAERI
jgi:thiamine pyrophosphokinase